MGNEKLEILYVKVEIFLHVKKFSLCINYYNTIITFKTLFNIINISFIPHLRTSFFHGKITGFSEIRQMNKNRLSSINFSSSGIFVNSL